MKILSLHTDYIKFKPLKKALRKIDDLSEKEKEEVHVPEALAVMTAVEKGDTNISEIVKKLVDEIQDIVKQVDVSNIVLYPYAHLSKDLADADHAVKVLVEAEKSLKKIKRLKIWRAPFGYYKEFEMKVKGHPLSELSREIKIDGDKTIIADLSDNDRKRMLREISKSKLDTSKLKDNDHRILGRKMDLWSFNEVAPGMAFWHHKGLHIKNKLIEYWRELHRARGYSEISTPQIMDRKLWEISGHWKLYHENMFTTKYEKRDFAVKPMSCPGGMLVYKNSPKSYKDMPLRTSELGVVHRQELSGTLAGLFRVIQFMQDDAHVFCTKEQLHDEIVGVLKMFLSMINQFGFEKYRFTISVRSDEKKDKYLGDDKVWKMAENALAKGLDALNLKYSIEPGEAKFYGPSLDLQAKDSQGREWQCSTLQLDFSIPERFDLTYTDEKGKDQNPIMLHHVVYGSIDRFAGVYTEHVDGKFPLWLSPNQIKVMTMNESINDYAREIKDKLFAEGFMVELDDRNESIGKKAREAQIQRFNYLVTVGDKEKDENVVAVRKRDSKEIIKMNVDEFISKLKKEIEQRE